MDSYDDKLKSIEETVKENNKILHHLRNGQRNARFMKLLYFAVIIVLGYISFQTIQPYLTEIQEIYGTMSDVKNKTGSLNLNSVTDFIKGIK